MHDWKLQRKDDVRIPAFTVSKKANDGPIELRCLPKGDASVTELH